jgi:methionyl-tRNA formyltransferase
LRIAFAGTAQFAVPSLERLVEAGHQVALVVTQPDRPAGRGLSPKGSPVKRAAERLQLDLYQPDRLKDATALERLRQARADLHIVVAYGQILRPELLAVPPMGTLNVHASLLPRHRGAAPIAWAILLGDTETGVTIMQMDAGLDTGPVLTQEVVPIGAEETAPSLEQRLAGRGAVLLVKTLQDLQQGGLTPRAQSAEGTTYARRLTSEDGKLDPQKMSAIEIDRRVRALNPQPGCWITLQGTSLKLLAGHRGASTADQGLALETVDGVYVADTVQPAGGRPMSAAAWVRGRR